MLHTCTLANVITANLHNCLPGSRKFRRIQGSVFQLDIYCHQTGICDDGTMIQTTQENIFGFKKQKRRQVNFTLSCGTLEV